MRATRCASFVAVAAGTARCGGADLWRSSTRCNLADDRAAAVKTDNSASVARIGSACGRLAAFEGNYQDSVLHVRAALEAQTRLGFGPDVLDSLDALAEI